MLSGDATLLVSLDVDDELDSQPTDDECDECEVDREVEDADDEADEDLEDDVEDELDDDALDSLALLLELLLLLPYSVLVLMFRLLDRHFAGIVRWQQTALACGWGIVCRGIRAEYL